MTLLDKETLNDPITRHMRKGVEAIRSTMTVGAALELIRSKGLKRQIVYFYVVDEQDRLAGVLPTRELLTAPLEQPIAEIMDKKVLAIPETFTVMDACELFVLHKFMAFPVVSKTRHLLGVVDVNLYASEVLGIAETEISNEVFESLGLHLERVLRVPEVLAEIRGDLRGEQAGEGAHPHLHSVRKATRCVLRWKALWRSFGLRCVRAAS